MEQPEGTDPSSLCLEGTRSTIELRLHDAKSGYQAHFAVHFVSQHIGTIPSRIICNPSFLNLRRFN